MSPIKPTPPRHQSADKQHLSEPIPGEKKRECALSEPLYPDLFTVRIRSVSATKLVVHEDELLEDGRLVLAAVLGLFVYLFTVI